MYTFQALSEEDRDLWLNAMDGKEPMFVHPPKPSDANETYLDEAGFNFIAKSFQVLENRGRSLDMGSLDPSSINPCLKLTLKRFNTLSPEFVNSTRDEHLLRWEGITPNCTNNFISASPHFFFTLRIEKQLERALALALSRGHLALQATSLITASLNLGQFLWLEFIIHSWNRSLEFFSLSKLWFLLPYNLLTVTLTIIP